MSSYGYIPLSLPSIGSPAGDAESDELLDPRECEHKEPTRKGRCPDCGRIMPEETV